MTLLAYIGVGSNIEPRHHIMSALDALTSVLEITRSSTFYWSAPATRPDQPRFLNGVWEARSAESARELKFEILRKVESDLGRMRSADKHAARSIDLDLLLLGDAEIAEDDLRLPDPDIQDRAFLFTPLFELAPQLARRFPATDPTGAAELEADLPFTEKLRSALAAASPSDRS